MKNWMKVVAAVMCCCGVAGAQAKYVPNDEAGLPPPKFISEHEALNPKVPSLFIVSDSTAKNGEGRGWGDHLANYFDTKKINVVNRAVAGRSSRSYIDEGLWTFDLGEMKPGDYVLMQMAHNDGGTLDGKVPRGTLPGIGDETKDVTLPDGRTVTVHSYGWYVRKYITDARAKGATVILLTPTARNIWVDGKMTLDTERIGYMRQIAAEQHVLVADMAALEDTYYQKMGEAAAGKYFQPDHMHSTEDGAEINAALVARALKIAGSPVAQYEKPQK